MKVNNYPVKLPSAGDRLFGSDASGDQKQFDMTTISNNVFEYEIGEYVEDEGGVIFYRYLDGDTQNYLVVSITNQSTGQAWSNVTSTSIGSTAQSTWDGLSNSNAIVGQVGFTNGAAKTCLDLVSLGKDDWYLPAIDELSLLWQNRFNVNRTLSGNSILGVIVGAVNIGYNTYWSSTEDNANSAWTYGFSNGFPNSGASKGNSNYVRAVRKFSI
jgi:hypothetical protein